MDDHIDMNEVIATFVSIHALIIYELDQRGALSLSDVIEKLSYLARLRRTQATEQGSPANDAVLIDALIGMLQSASPPSWTPVVISNSEFNT